MEKKCVVCGKLFVAYGQRAKYCSFECSEVVGKTHRVKPAGWSYRGVCPRCGIEFDWNRKRTYCSDECMYQAQLEKAHAACREYMPPCKQCGKVLPLWRKVFCSNECEHEYYRKTDKVPLTDEIIQQRIAERYDNIKHISGHKSDGRLTVKCKVCGGEFRIGEKSTRVNTGNRVRACPHCIEAERLIEKETIERNQLMNRLVSLFEKRGKLLCDAENRKKRCAICGNEFIPQHGNTLVCSEFCAKKRLHSAKKQIRHTRKVRKKCNGEIDHSISLEKLIKRDRNTCHICGHKCDSRDFIIDANGSYIAGANHPSIDHVMPLSKGGSHTWGNIKLAHHRCNSQKSDLLCYGRPSGQMALAI